MVIELLRWPARRGFERSFGAEPMQWLTTARAIAAMIITPIRTLLRTIQVSGIGSPRSASATTRAACGSELISSDTGPPGATGVTSDAASDAAEVITAVTDEGAAASSAASA